jgi:cell wall-associated NlpC family hydrolase
MSPSDFFELLPDTAPNGELSWRPAGRIPERFRHFGKMLDTGNLQAGDLVLLREIEPDMISRKIKETQIALGYAEQDAMWTHAALYLGDGLRVVEATFDSPIKGGSVKASFLYDYCGRHAICVRRPRCVSATKDAWLIAIEAAMGIGKKYDFLAALKIFFDGQASKKGDWDADTRTYVSPGVLCSTFYADCYGKVAKRSLGDSGVCVPASLSMSDEFDDLPLQWLRIAEQRLTNRRQV